ncbi:hypothetical protein BDV95DRAFT_610862 [Massariosphaeria phaeospora]|uniref:Uncharacterized protein n=1 Tax=Massariosphaeria phaeospora TaxID=100035 RepID=A0A7C8I7Y4_9PLEO|nr:hypothetical protein BDV95DRAFT_610862 [Massariosphaeria phaeospora]
MQMRLVLEGGNKDGSARETGEILDPRELNLTTLNIERFTVVFDRNNWFQESEKLREGWLNVKDFPRLQNLTIRLNNNWYLNGDGDDDDDRDDGDDGLGSMFQYLPDGFSNSDCNLLLDRLSGVQNVLKSLCIHVDWNHDCDFLDFISPLVILLPTLEIAEWMYELVESREFFPKLEWIEFQTSSDRGVDYQSFEADEDEVWDALEAAGICTYISYRSQDWRPDWDEGEFAKGVGKIADWVQSLHELTYSDVDGILEFWKMVKRST